MRFLRDNFLFACVLLTVLLLPWAHVKIEVSGVPLYLPEWTVLGAMVVLLWRYVRQKGTPMKVVFSDHWSMLGLGLLLLGAGISFAVNPFSLTGLGLLKSWFFFPLAFGVLLYMECFDGRKREAALVVWSAMLFLVVVRSLSFLLGGELTYDGRLAGPYTSPNFLGIILAPAPFLAAYFLMKKMERPHTVGRALSLMLGVGSLICLSATRSYGVWLALLAATLAFFVIRWRSNAKGYKQLLGVMLVVMIFLLGAFFLERGSEKWQALSQLDERSSLASRLMIWRSAGAIIRDHPFAGIGPGRFQTEYLAYQHLFPPYLEWAVPEPHNFFLAAYLSTGLLGLGGFLLLLGRLGFLFWQYGRVLRVWEPQWTLLIALWMLFIVYGLTDTPLFKTDLAYSFFLLWALSLSLVQKNSARTESGV